MFTVTPQAVEQLPGRLFGLAGVVDVVEVTCPVCGCDRLNLAGEAYECCDCGMVFKTKYTEVQDE